METTVTLFDNKTLQKVFLQEAVMAVLNARKAPFKLDNKRDGLVFFCDTLEYVVRHDSHGLYTTHENAIAGFERYGIHNGLELILAMNEKREELIKLGYPMDKIKDPKELIKKYNIIGKNSMIDMDTTRTLVVRSKYGNYPILYYDWNGPICDCPQMWAIKLDYHYKTGCKYFDVRPILYSTWMELPKELQTASCVVDSSDMEDKLEIA